MRVRVPTRFDDYDVFGHVNHARLIAYCQEHRTEMLERLEYVARVAWDAGGFVVARVEADFRAAIDREARVVEIAARVQSIGRASVRINYQVESKGVIAAEIVEVLVAVDGDGASRPLDVSERAWLSEFMDADS